MNVEELIASGRLELYVSGSLSSKEMSEIHAMVEKYPELKREVESIESTYQKLGENLVNKPSASIWSRVLRSIRDQTSKDPGKSTGKMRYLIGWAAVAAAIIGIFWLMGQNKLLKEEIELNKFANEQLSERLKELSNQVIESDELLAAISSDDFKTIHLPGNQPVAPEAYARVLYNESTGVAYVDSHGLPEVKEDNVYQVWSLLLDPLTPSSMGLLEPVEIVAGTFYKFENVPPSEGFGITLEPKGGSDFPTLEQLYTLGTIQP